MLQGLPFSFEFALAAALKSMTPTNLLEGEDAADESNSQKCPGLPELKRHLYKPMDDMT